jgi:hypothetical protein
MKIPAFTLLLAITATAASAFEVTKNVNTGKPPVEKVVLFQKGHAPDSVAFFDNENCRMSFTPDGAIEARITGNGEVKCGINWKPEGARGETFNTKDYGHVLISCRMEGSNKTTGSTQPGQRPDNLWFPAVLFNAAGQLVGSANLADGTPDGRTPDQTTTVVLPMLLFTYFGDHDSSQVRGIGFTWPKTRANIDRDYRLVIEKIALTE